MKNKLSYGCLCKFLRLHKIRQKTNVSVYAFVGSALEKKGMTRMDREGDKSFVKRHADYIIKEVSKNKDKIPKKSIYRNQKSQGSQESKEFLESWQWQTLRMKAIKVYGRSCMCCGAVAGNGVYMCVDHIKPRSKYPDLSLDINNLQILCNQCNKGKGAWDETDWRTEAQKREMLYYLSSQKQIDCIKKDS